MSFKDCDENAPALRFLSMADEGSSVTVIPVAEPGHRTTVSFGRTRMEYVFPVATEEGLRALCTNKVLYTMLRDGWSAYVDKPIQIIRKHPAYVTKPVYEITKAKGTKALTASRREVTPDEVAELLAYVCGEMESSEKSRTPF